jgi:hypothetical protein
MRPFSRNSDVSRATSSCTQRQADAATPHRAVPSCPLESSRVSSRSERSAHSGRTSTRSCGGTSHLWEIYKFQTSPGATTTYMASFDPGGRCLPALDFRRCDVPLGRTKPELIKKLEPGQRGWDRLTEMKLACGTSWNENLATRSNYARYSHAIAYPLCLAFETTLWSAEAQRARSACRTTSRTCQYWQISHDQGYHHPAN